MEYSLGPIYRLHRKNKHIITEEVCKKTQISTRKLSEFENGKKSLEEDVIKELYHCLHIKYFREPYNMEKFCIAFQNFFDDILTYRDFTKSYQEIQKMEEYIQTTELYPQYLLSKLIYHVYTRNAFYDYKGNIAILESLFPYLNEFQKQIYFDTVGVYFKDELDYEAALNYLNKAAVYGYEQVSAMVYYHKTMILKKTGRLIEAMESITEAKQIFDRTMNINRSLLCSGTLGLIYTNLGLYDYSIDTFQKSIKYMTELNLKKDLLAASNNLTWSYLLFKQFDKAIENANRTIDLKRNHVPSYFFKSYAYRQLGEKYKAKECIKKAKSLSVRNPCTAYMKAMIDAFYTLLSDQKSVGTKVRKLKLALQQAEDCHDQKLELFVLDMIVGVYKDANEYENAFQYQRAMINIYEKRR